jgi:hypothetical protein
LTIIFYQLGDVLTPFERWVKIRPVNADVNPDNIFHGLIVLGRTPVAQNKSYRIQKRSSFWYVGSVNLSPSGTVAQRIGDDPATLLRNYTKRKRSKKADKNLSDAIAGLATGFLGV